MKEFLFPIVDVIFAPTPKSAKNVNYSRKL